jgi:hypothetical protein
MVGTMMELSGLAARYAAHRVRAAEALLAQYSNGKRYRGGLARDFGSEPEAVFKPVFNELCDIIGYSPSESWVAFIRSLEIGYEHWHDGVGYDIEAMAGMSEEERQVVRQVMRNRLAETSRLPEWRDMEVAAALGDTETLEQLLDYDDAQVRLRASRYLNTGGLPEAEICKALVGPDPAAASMALDHLAEHKSEKTRQAVIELIRRVDANFIQAAFVGLEVFGGVEDAWPERPFLFEVQEQGPDGPLMEQLISRLEQNG